MKQLTTLEKLKQYKSGLHPVQLPMFDPEVDGKPWHEVLVQEFLGLDFAPDDHWCNCTACLYYRLQQEIKANAVSTRDAAMHLITNLYSTRPPNLKRDNCGRDPWCHLPFIIERYERLFGL